MEVWFAFGPFDKYRKRIIGRLDVYIPHFGRKFVTTGSVPHTELLILERGNRLRRGTAKYDVLKRRACFEHNSRYTL